MGSLVGAGIEPISLGKLACALNLCVISLVLVFNIFLEKQNNF